MATVRMSARGASVASSASPLSRITDTRRAFNVSAASGVRCPPATSVTVLPYSMTRDFMAVSSYGTSTKSSGQVQVLKDLGSAIEGRDVLIVEDIVDTGLTLTYLQDILRARSPRHLRTACLLSKPSRRKIDVKVEYVGFTIEDKFVVGYGLDYAEQYRNLPYIAVIGD